ncbi:hypothetical protein NEUTE1DRAFT_118903 [Neurospora tetrasperma FGSC 2508]|uniref:Uncharacterized protein n=1 Tax=Neurospora tetrasperma (strain FGSC 2508 / ATCC MYA-4615 / P0657) TaxID=510951 RepID=F8N4U3_NEUT8|nr:uncharacterized protein NEUTE1DRAFT_118903 [Neurospora tetrasperma FGSC 2508]EGO52727.1 hypothetical protein NEUTE1DRAFT_118903 [Neurospora tetrasperma FGSC 2508]
MTATGCYQLRLRLRRELTLVIYHTDSTTGPNRSFTERIQVDGRRRRKYSPTNAAKIGENDGMQNIYLQYVAT